MAYAAARPPRTAEMVKVKREVLAVCMRCPLCNNLLSDATTISECLHTFCRKCILEKLTNEEVDCCPICDIDLGCAPIEKLRPDHSLQDVRAKIFPSKRRKVDAPEVEPPTTLPVRRKERSLSSLVVSTPQVAAQAGLTGRRTKVMTRRASSLRGLSPLIDDTIKKENSSNGGRENSPETLTKTIQNKRQNSSNAESSTKMSNGGESFDKSELWKPLNCLVEAANRTRAVKSGPPSPVIKAEQSNGFDSEGQVHKSKTKEHPSKLKAQDNKNGDRNSPLSSGVVRRRRRRRRDLGISTQELIDVAHATREKRTGPIWLSLIPSFEQTREPMPPPIATCYLRIKDGNLPVSFIQKYLVKKINLSSEAEYRSFFNSGGEGTEVEAGYCEGNIRARSAALHFVWGLIENSLQEDRLILAHKAIRYCIKFTFKCCQSFDGNELLGEYACKVEAVPGPCVCQCYLYL